MPMRLPGLNSGIDTESIISELVAVRREKVNGLKKKQTTLQWKQEAWKSLNSKANKFFNTSLSEMRYATNYSKKVTTVSDPNKATVLTKEGAPSSVQSLKILELARNGYLTGGNFSGGIKGSTKVTDAVSDGGLGVAAGSKILVRSGGKETEITIGKDTTVSGFVASLNSAGLVASFDEGNQRFFIGAKENGAAGDFSIVGLNANGVAALDAMKISSYDTSTDKLYQDFINNADATKAKRISTKISNYLKAKTDATVNMSNTLKTAGSSAYSKFFKGVDTTDADAVMARIDDVKADPAKYGIASGDATFKALSDLQTNYNGYKDKLANAESHLVATTDADGKTTYDLLESDKQAIRNDVDAEVVHAQAMLGGTHTGTAANKMSAKDAVIDLNGVQYTSTSNTLVVNGLTITVNARTGVDETLTISTKDDTEGIYDMVKSFLKEYNSLINEMDKLYNAPSSKGYEPLTEDEREAMSEEEIKTWETKIKDSILRRDDTTKGVADAMKQIMSAGVTVNGKKMYLSDFGINTASYFDAADNERNAYHIDGDKEDPIGAKGEDVLKGLIASDPTQVTDFFVALSRDLWGKMNEMMKKTEYSSSFTLYEDVRMKNDYEDYKKKIAEEEAKVTAYEDKWYAKFSAMEVAMAKMQSNQNAIAGLLGG